MLLLRVALASALLVQGVSYFGDSDVGAGALAIGLISIAAAALILVGMLTPVAGMVVALSGIGIAFSLLPSSTRPLFGSGIPLLFAISILAVTQQDLDNAMQNNMAAKAQLQAAKAQVETSKAQITAALAAVQADKAAVETARINLGFPRVTSPIDGIPGIAQLQVGALVSPASGAITTVSTVDPIKVYFTISEQGYLDYTHRFPTAEKTPGEQ